MKKLVFGCLLAAGCAFVPTLAAQDYGCPTQYCASPCGTQYDDCCSNRSFDGFYVGINGGVLTHEAYRNDISGFLVDTSSWNFSKTGGTAGVQLGYDWMCCNSVWGIVADWNWAHARHTLEVVPDFAAIRDRVRWFSTIRARVGVPICDALFYLTAGAAVSKFHTRWNTTTVINFNNNRWGWVGGVGIEWSVWCNMSLGVEFLCMHFAKRERSRDIAGLGDLRFGHSDILYTGRVLLNYRFGNLCCGY